MEVQYIWHILRFLGIINLLGSHGTDIMVYVWCAGTMKGTVNEGCPSDPKRDPSPKRSSSMDQWNWDILTSLLDINVIPVPWWISRVFMCIKNTLELGHQIISNPHCHPQKCGNSGRARSHQGPPDVAATITTGKVLMTRPGKDQFFWKAKMVDF